jgi:hypothetical protein
MLKKAEDEKNVLTAPTPSNNRMFEDKENQSPTLITDTADMTCKNFLFPNVIPDQKGFGSY